MVVSYTIQTSSNETNSDLEGILRGIQEAEKVCVSPFLAVLGDFVLIFQTLGVM